MESPFADLPTHFRSHCLTYSRHCWSQAARDQNFGILKSAAARLYGHQGHENAFRISSAIDFPGLSFTRRQRLQRQFIEPFTTAKWLRIKPPSPVNTKKTFKLSNRDDSLFKMSKMLNTKMSKNRLGRSWPTHKRAHKNRLRTFLDWSVGRRWAKCCPGRSIYWCF